MRALRTSHAYAQQGGAAAHRACYVRFEVRPTEPPPGSILPHSAPALLHSVSRLLAPAHTLACNLQMHALRRAYATRTLHAAARHL